MIGIELTPTKSTGYWLMVQGLTPGEHTIQFGGSADNTSPTGAFQTHVIDHITVV